MTVVYRISDGLLLWRVSRGFTFYALSGKRLATADDVRAAIQRDGECDQYEAEAVQRSAKPAKTQPDTAREEHVQK